MNVPIVAGDIVDDGGFGRPRFIRVSFYASLLLKRNQRSSFMILRFKWFRTNSLRTRARACAQGRSLSSASLQREINPRAGNSPRGEFLARNCSRVRRSTRIVAKLTIYHRSAGWSLSKDRGTFTFASISSDAFRVAFANAAFCYRSAFSSSCVR